MTNTENILRTKEIIHHAISDCQVGQGINKKPFLFLMSLMLRVSSEMKM